MKSISILLLVLVVGLAACKDDSIGDCSTCEIEKLSQNAGAEYLASKYSEIQALSSSVNCTDATSWDYLPIGSKACGGPTGYIAYSKTIDKVSFIKKVSDYTSAQAAFNKKWGVISDCAFVSPPKSISCVDGKAKLNY